MDLFPGWVENGEVYIWPHTFGELDQADVFPLQESKIEGVKIPRDPEKMLTVNYGQNWQKPNKLWKFRWGKANERFQSLHQTMQTVFPAPKKKRG